MNRNLTSEEKSILGEFADWSRLGTEYYNCLINKDWDQLIPAIFKKFNDPKQLAFIISTIQDIVKNDKLLDYIDLDQYFKQYENGREEFEKRGLITNNTSNNEESNGFIIADVSGEARYFAKPSSRKMWTPDLRGARIFKKAEEAQELIDDQLHMEGDFEVRPLAKAKANRQDFIKVLTKYGFKKLTPAGTKWEKVSGDNFIKIIFGTAPSYKGIPAVHAHAYSENMGEYPDEVYHSATELDKFIRSCLEDFGINESLNESKSDFGVYYSENPDDEQIELKWFDKPGYYEVIDEDGVTLIDNEWIDTLEQFEELCDESSFSYENDEEENLVDFYYAVYADKDDDGLDWYDTEEEAIEVAKTLGPKAHVVFIPNPDSDAGPEYREFIKYYAPYDDYEIVWEASEYTNNDEGDEIDESLNEVKEPSNMVKLKGTFPEFGGPLTRREQKQFNKWRERRNKEKE